MKYILKAFSMFIAVIIVAASCKTEIVTPIDIFSLEQGGYMRIIAGTSCVSSASVSRKNMTGTNLTMIHEAVTPEKGARFTAYDVEIRHVGTTSTAWKAFRLSYEDGLWTVCGFSICLQKKNDLRYGL